MMNSGIVFDLDGTLIDSRKDLAAAVNLMRKNHNLELLPVELVVSYVGNGAKKLVDRAFQGTGIDPVPLYEEFGKCYEITLTDTTVLYPGTAEGLKKLYEGGWKLALASNKPERFCIEILRRLGVLPYFSFILGGGHPEIPLKPAPDPLLKCLKEMNADPVQSWIFGDHYTDLGAGHAAGMHTAYAAYGFGDPKEEKWDFRAENFMEFACHVLE